MARTHRSQLRVGRIIAVAMLVGVVLFWIACLYLTDGGSAPLAMEPPLSPVTTFWIWTAVGAAGFLGALFFRRRAIAGGGGPARAGGESTGDRLTAVQTNLVVAWALLEGPALLAGVFFLLAGDESVLWLAVLVYMIGMAVTFPRAAWYEGRGSDSRAG